MSTVMTILIYLLVASVSVFTSLGLFYYGIPFVEEHPYLREFFQCGEVSLPSMAVQAALPAITLYSAGFVALVCDMWHRHHQTLSEAKIKQDGFTPKCQDNMYQLACWCSLYNIHIGIFSILFVYQPLGRYLNEDGICQPQSNDAYSIGINFVKLYLMGVVSDVIFYLLHRTAHEIPFLYRYVHKMHHWWVESFGIAAVAAHPLEHFFVNLPSALLPGVLLGVPFAWNTAYMVIASVLTVRDHSGYSVWFFFQGSSAKVAHDRHHHFLDCEYGAGFFCDWLFGTTYEDWKRKKAAKLA